MNKLLSWLTTPPTDGHRSILLLRLMAGGVFFWEGLLKFVYTNQGVGRFAKLGIPFPNFTANFIGGLEIAGGLLLLSGFLTRLIAVPSTRHRGVLHRVLRRVVRADVDRAQRVRAPGRERDRDGRQGDGGAV